MSVHTLAVDAYAIAHTGTENPQAISSAYVQLARAYKLPGGLE
ncbi:MAG: trimethylamine:corrinoid methyltransferase-like protein [Candidatus Azotimanducaceae bacterium]|jgi:trimethylamine:corrinoid methyltransferase-like protein